MPEQENRNPDIAAVIGLNADGSGGRRWGWRWVIVGAIGLLVAALIVAPMFSGGGSTRYLTEPVARRDLTVIVTATGTVQPTNQVEVSSELSGTIRTVLVDYNSNVKAGDVLAELDTDKLKASVESARAKLAAAEAQVKNAEATQKEMKVDYERKQQLVARNTASAKDLDAAEAAYDRAVASVASAKADVAVAAADLKVNETNLAKSCICSPIDGVVLSRDVEPGQTVASSLQAPVLFTIAEDLRQMEVQVDVDEADVGKVREGQTATFTVDAYPDKVFNAEIKELRFGSEVVQGVVTYKAVLATSNEELLLRPGMTATAEIIVKEVAQAVVVANAALRFSPPSETDGDDRGFLEMLLPRPHLRAASDNTLTTGSERSIYTLVDGAPLEVPVVIGSTDGQYTEVVQGDLEIGETVIIDSAANGG